MIELKLRNIIIENNFTPLSMGMSEKELTNLLGNPTSRFDNGYGSVVVAYGGYEFAFFDDKLHYFQNDNFKESYIDWVKFENDHFKIDTWLIKEHDNLSIERFIEELKFEKIQFKLEKPSTQNYTKIKLMNGMQLEFDNSDRMLYAIRYESFSK